MINREDFTLYEDFLKAYNKDYYQKNKKKILKKANAKYRSDPVVARAYHKKQRDKNKDKIKIRNKIYNEKNKERRNKKNRERYHNDPEYRAMIIERVSKWNKKKNSSGFVEKK